MILSTAMLTRSAAALGHAGSPPAMLASVRSAGEALTAVAGGADIIDAKEPQSGALGAVSPEVLTSIRRAVPAGIPVSATVGDIAAGELDDVVAGIEAAAEAGADWVKIGLFPPYDGQRFVDTLAANELAFGRRVLVMLADLAIDLDLIPALPAAGFAGVMLDTAQKSSGALPDVIGDDAIARFVLTARRSHLRVGLAGSLRVWHIPMLTGLRPDILGFRGALCRDGRVGGIDEALVAEVAAAVSRSVGQTAAK